MPAITVITDGGWSIRSHKHSCNAKLSVAIIIGQKFFSLVSGISFVLPVFYVFIITPATKIRTVLHLK